MRGFNKAIIMGNLVRDPEIRYTSSQQPVASFSVAINRTWKDRNGEVKDDVTYIPVVVWGRMAENCSQYLHKGSGVLAEGRISVRSYEAQTGEKKYVTEVVADTVQFVGGGQGASAQQGAPAQSQYAARPRTGTGYNRKPSAPGFDPNAPATLDGGTLDVSEASFVPPAPAPAAEDVEIPF